jgi:DNA mismatch repair ATPase MutL
MLNLGSANISSSFNKIILPRQHKHNYCSKLKTSKIKKINKINFTSSLEKSQISQLKLIGQFDKKFLIFMNSQNNNIVIFDQHAIHERILYEFYYLLLKKEFLNFDLDETENNPSMYNSFESVFSKQYLDRPLKLIIDERKIPKMRLDSNKASNLFHFEFCIKKDSVYVYSVPIVFDRLLEEKEYIDIFENIFSHLDILVEVSTKGESKINKKFLYIVYESFLYQIKSKACKDAVKFNEILDDEFMLSLLKNLSRCNNPFLCAHGRHNFFIIAEKS